MSVDKLVDSSKLDACCLAEANAIRAKTGDSSSLTYDWSNSKGFADAIAAIPSGGGGISIDWADVTEVTIGANSITNISGVQTYFSGYTFTFVLLASPLTADAQFVSALSVDQDGSMTWPTRYRGGKVQSTIVGNAYDGKLIEGTKYYLLKRK